MLVGGRWAGLLVSPLNQKSTDWTHNQKRHSCCWLDHLSTLWSIQLRMKQSMVVLWYNIFLLSHYFIVPSGTEHFIALYNLHCVVTFHIWDTQYYYKIMMNKLTFNWIKPTCSKTLGCLDAKSELKSIQFSFSICHVAKLITSSLD